MKYKIALIGYGRFGRLAGHFLKQFGTVYAFDKNHSLNLERGIRRATHSDLKSCHIVVISVPINQVEIVLKNISAELHPRAIVAEVCSVKEKPAQWMKNNLPLTVQLIGIHPLFGPDSIGESLTGAEIVICPIRVSGKTLLSTKKLSHKCGCRVTEMNPRAHDKLIASTLFLTQYLGRALAKHDVKTKLPRTENYKKLEQIIRASTDDTDELFRDIYRYNRYAKKIPLIFKDYFKKLDKSMNNFRSN
jgi:prephenate dehydrogenase